MLRFDTRQPERVRVPVSGNVNWLDYTHGITFAAAVRQQCEKFPELWAEGLLQMACFAGRNTAYMDAELDVSRWSVPVAGAFLEDAVNRLFDHGQGEYIVSVHLLKTTLAVRQIAEAGVPPTVQAEMLAALNRFLQSPLKRRQLRRTAHQAIEFVARE